MRTKRGTKAQGVLVPVRKRPEDVDFSGVSGHMKPRENRVTAGSAARFAAFVSAAVSVFGRRSLPPADPGPVPQPGRERPPSRSGEAAPPASRGGRSRPGCLSMSTSERPADDAENHDETTRRNGPCR